MIKRGVYVSARDVRQSTTITDYKEVHESGMGVRY